jgi:hypothetical protein
MYDKDIIKQAQQSGDFSNLDLSLVPEEIILNHLEDIAGSHNFKNIPAHLVTVENFQARQTLRSPLHYAIDNNIPLPPKALTRAFLEIKNKQGNTCYTTLAKQGNWEKYKIPDSELPSLAEFETLEYEDTGPENRNDQSLKSGPLTTASTIGCFGQLPKKYITIQSLTRKTYTGGVTRLHLMALLEATIIPKIIQKPEYLGLQDDTGNTILHCLICHTNINWTGITPEILNTPNKGGLRPIELYSDNAFAILKSIPPHLITRQIIKHEIFDYLESAESDHEIGKTPPHRWSKLFDLPTLEDLKDYVEKSIMDNDIKNSVYEPLTRGIETAKKLENSRLLLSQKLNQFNEPKK